MTIAREEIFGPVLAVVPSATESEAVEIANGSRESHVADGAFKQSGSGREMGVFGLKECLEVKAMSGYDEQQRPKSVGNYRSYRVVAKSVRKAR